MRLLQPLELSPEYFPLQNAMFLFLSDNTNHHMFCVFETGSPVVVQASPGLNTFLPRPLSTWDYWCASPCLTSGILFIIVFVVHWSPDTPFASLEVIL